MAKPNKLPNGRWRIRWTDEDGIRRSKVFDSKADAEFKLKEFETLSEKIKRGLAPRSARTISFTELCEHWLTYRTSQKRSPKDDKNIINTHLIPFFGKFALNSINQSLVDKYIFEKAHLNKKTIHNHITLLISLLRSAAQGHFIDEIPNIKKPKIPKCSKDFRYLRSADLQIVY